MQRSRWTRPGWMAVACAVLIAYGSLIPFDIDWPAQRDQSESIYAALAETLFSPSWAHADEGASSLGVPYWLSDNATNLLLYMPLGVTLRMAIRPRVRSRLLQVLIVAIAGLTLSWLVESLQSLTPTRVASISDVLLNTCGAVVGGIFSAAAWRVSMRLAFFLYCRTAALRLVIKRVLAWPVTAMGIAAMNAALIAGWYVRELRRTSAKPSESALPFENVFHLPYDIAALMLGEALLAYIAMGCLLLLLTYSGARRLAMNWVVLIVLLLALSAEFLRSAKLGTTADLTHTLIALVAAVLLAVTVYSFTHAVQRANRRSRPETYPGPERRREPHDYA